MNKTEFLQELERFLQKLSYDERQDVLQDFEEHFAIGLEKGETEQHIAASLGSPEQIAKDLLINYNLDEKTPLQKQPEQDTARVILLTVLLVMFNLIIVLGPFMAIVGTILSGWMTGIAFVMTPFLYLFKVMFLPNETYLFELFLAIGLTGLGILIGIAMFYITRFTIQLTIRYVKFNIRIAKGEN